MKALVFGKTGQVATELLRRGPSKSVQIEALDRSAADLGDAEHCVALVSSTNADVVINAAAYTSVDGAEGERDLAFAVNARTPGAMARAAALRGLPFLHISSDYVFDGSGDTPWRPSDKTSPLGAYGASKRDGEVAVLAAGGKSLVLRTSWVFSPHGNNFVKTMLRLASTRSEVAVVADQIGGPTPASAIADTVLTLAKASLLPDFVGGIYHFAGGPDTSWADFARQVFANSDRAVKVNDIATDAWPTPAARPKNSRLDCSRIQSELGIIRPDWRAAIDTVLNELRATQSI